MNLSLLSFFFFFPSTYGQGNHSLVKQEIKRTIWDFLDGSVVKTPALPIQVRLVQSLVGKLRSHMLHGTVKRERERERERERTVWKNTNSETKQKEQSVSYIDFLPLNSYYNRSSKSHYVKISIIISYGYFILNSKKVFKRYKKVISVLFSPSWTVL